MFGNTQRTEVESDPPKRLEASKVEVKRTALGSISSVQQQTLSSAALGSASIPEPVEKRTGLPIVNRSNFRARDHDTESFIPELETDNYHIQDLSRLKIPLEDSPQAQAVQSNDAYDTNPVILKPLSDPDRVHLDAAVDQSTNTEPSPSDSLSRSISVHVAQNDRDNVGVSARLFASILTDSLSQAQASSVALDSQEGISGVPSTRDLADVQHREATSDYSTAQQQKQQTGSESKNRTWSKAQFSISTPTLSAMTPSEQWSHDGKWRSKSSYLMKNDPKRSSTVHHTRTPRKKASEFQPIDTNKDSRGPLGKTQHRHDLNAEDLRTFPNVHASSTKIENTKCDVAVSQEHLDRSCEHSQSSVKDLPEFRLLQETQNLRYTSRKLQSELLLRTEQVVELRRARANLEQERTDIAEVVQDQRAQLSIRARLNEEQENKIQLLLHLKDSAFKSLANLWQNMQTLQADISLFSHSSAGIKQDLEAVRKDFLAMNCATRDREGATTRMRLHLEEIRASLESEKIRTQILQSTCDRNAGLMSEDRDLIAELSKQVSSLVNAEIDARRTSCAELEQQHATVQSLTTDLRTCREVNQAQSNGLESVTTILMQMQSTLEHQIESLTKINGELTAELEASHRSAQDLSSNLSLKIQSFESLSTECNNLREQISNSGTEIAALENENSKQRQMIADQQEEMKTHKSQHDVMLAQLTTEWRTRHEQGLEILRKERDKIASQVSQDRTKFKSMFDNEVTMNKIIEDLRAENRSFQGLLTSTVNGLTEKFNVEQEQTESRLQRSLAQGKMHLENQLKSQESRSERLQRDVQRLEEEISVIPGLEAEKAELIQSKVSLQHELYELRDQLKHSKLENAKLENKDSSEAAVQFELANLRNEHDSFQDLKKAHSALERVHTEAQVTINALTEETMKLKRQISACDDISRSTDGMPIGQNFGLVPQLYQHGARASAVHKQTRHQPFGRSSGSVEEDRSKSLDFVLDSPPTSGPSGATMHGMKEKNKDRKKRAALGEVVRNTPDLSMESCGPSLHKNISNLNQLQNAYVTRNRSSSRIKGYKKRKSG